MGNDKQETIEVMLDVFSGRPNPSWTVSERQIEELQRFLDLPKEAVRKQRLEPPGLGYRGFVITNWHLRRGLPFRVQVYGGALAVTKKPLEGKKEQAQVAIYNDTHRLEAWLLEQAAQQGYAETIEKMGGPRRPEIERSSD